MKKFIALVLPSAICAWATAFVFAGAGCFINLNDTENFLRKTGLDELPIYESCSSVDTHGGFHGDGELTMFFTFSERNGAKLEEKLATADNWYTLPMNGVVEKLFYRERMFTPSASAFHENLDRIENGYYFFYDKQTESHLLPTDDYFETSYSYNVRISVFDTDNNALYYYELDT